MATALQPPPSRAVIQRFRSGPGWLEAATRPLAPALRPYVRQWSGYVERTPGTLRRRELPAPQVVVIFEFGPPIQVYDEGSTERSARFPGGFAAGLSGGFTLTEHDGFQSGVQVDLTPLGARRFFGLPMSDLAGCTVALRDLLPAAEREIGQRLGDAEGWDARLGLVERLLLARLAPHDPRPDPVAWAVQQIAASGGAADLRELGRQLGYSQTHIVRLFRDRVGVAPKHFAQIVRFDRLVARLRSGPPASWSDLALECGYYDQSHLVREVRRFSGQTPTATRAALAELQPDEG